MELNLGAFSLGIPDLREPVFYGGKVYSWTLCGTVHFSCLRALVVISLLVSLGYPL